MSELRELLLDELADILYAENLLLKALPKMAKAARSESLREAFEEHLQQTETQVERLKEVFDLFGKPAKAKKCEAMEGLVAEGKTIMDEWKGSPACDAALISAAQKIEHYEIASYGCLVTWADMLGNSEAYDLLEQTLDEEENTDERLTELAEECINEEALDSGDDDQEEVAKPKAASKAKPKAGGTKAKSGGSKGGKKGRK